MSCRYFSKGKCQMTSQKGIVNKYRSYSQISPAEKAWITIRAKQQGKCPVMVHAGIKAAFTKKNGR